MPDQGSDLPDTGSSTDSATAVSGGRDLNSVPPLWAFDNGPGFAFQPTGGFGDHTTQAMRYAFGLDDPSDVTDPTMLASIGQFSLQLSRGQLKAYSAQWIKYAQRRDRRVMSLLSARRRKRLTGLRQQAAKQFRLPIPVIMRHWTKRRGRLLVMFRAMQTSNTELIYRSDTLPRRLI